MTRPRARDWVQLGVVLAVAAVVVYECCDGPVREVKTTPGALSFTPSAPIDAPPGESVALVLLFLSPGYSTMYEAFRDSVHVAWTPRPSGVVRFESYPVAGLYQVDRMPSCVCVDGLPVVVP